jgi:hypothetical protein
MIKRGGSHRENKISKANPRFGKVRLINNSFYRVSSIDAASDASIVDLSIERKVTPNRIGYGLQANPTLLVPIGST